MAHRKQDLTSKWNTLRIRPDQYKELKAIARAEEISAVSLNTEALERYLRRRKLGERWEYIDPALEPRNEIENRAVRMILNMIREPYDRAEQITLKTLTELYENRCLE